jgi:hypothetical protein
MNKRIKFLFIGFLIIGTISLLFGVFGSRSADKPKQAENAVIPPPDNDTQTRTAQNGIAPTVTQPVIYETPIPTIDNVSPENTAVAFYRYFSSSANPLANGAFQKNPYLTDDFKSIIADLYHNGNIPVFCPQNQKANVTVGKTQQVYNSYGYLTQVIISETTPEVKDLYRVMLKDKDGHWQIDDINCIRK